MNADIRKLLEWIYNDGYGREVFPTNLDGSPSEEFLKIEHEVIRNDNQSDVEAALDKTIEQVRVLVRTGMQREDVIVSQFDKIKELSRLQYVKEPKTIVSASSSIVPSEGVLV